VEGTGNWMYLYETIEKHVPEIVLAHPLKTRAIAEARIKTDTRWSSGKKLLAAAMTATEQPSASASSTAAFSAPAARSLLPIRITGFCLPRRNSAAASTAACSASGSLGSSLMTALIGPGGAHDPAEMLQAISM
jgi:hypothetical protein